MISKKKKTFLPQQPIQPIRTFAPLPSGPQEGLASERAYEQEYAATLPQPVQSLPVQPQQPTPTPAPDYWGGVKDVGKLIYDIPAQFTGAAGRLLEDKYPGERETIADTMRQYGRERTEQRAGELTPEQRASPVLPFKLPFMDKPITRGDIADTSQSTGFSGIAMGAGIAGGAAGLLAAAPEGGLPAPVTVPAGAMAASGAAAYKMDRVAAIEQLVDHFAEAKGRPLTVDEQGALVDAHDSELISHAAWEAGPEALSNVFGVIPGVKNIAKGMSKAAVGKLAKGLAGLYGTELATETITQMGQQRAESRMGTSSEPERDWSDPAAWKQSFQEIAPQTLILSTGMGGAGAVAGAGKKALSPAQQPQLPPSGPTQRAVEEVQPIQPDQAPGVTIEPEGFSAQLQADTADAFDQARFAVQQGQIQPGTEEFQAVKESIEEIQQRNIPEEQETLKQNKDVVDFFTKEQPPPSTVESAMQRGAQTAGVLDETLARPAATVPTQPAGVEQAPALTTETAPLLERSAAINQKDMAGQESTGQEKGKKWTTEEVDRINKIPLEEQTAEQKEFVRDLAGPAFPGQPADAPLEAIPGEQPTEVTLKGEPESSATQKIKEQSQSTKEWVDFGKETETLNIPRAEMPQVKSEDRGALANYLRSRGVEYTRADTLPTELKPTQKEFSPEKIQKAREYTGTERAILVSEDDHVIDGHHQWVKGLIDSPARAIPVIRLGGKVDEILGLVKDFPSSKTSAELSGKTPVKEKELGTRVLKEGLGVEGERTYLKDFTPKEFQEEFRNPKEMPRLTDSSEYKKILPDNTEKIISEAATIKRKLNDAKASVKENKQHLVKLFNKEAKTEIEVQFEGRPYTIKKPEAGAEVIILNQKGDDASEALKAKFKAEGQMEYDPKPGKRSLSIQPVKVGKSHASQYGPKTLLQAAIEHVELSSEQYQYGIEEKVIKAEMLVELVDNLKDKGVGHSWRNEAGDTSFSVKRAPAAKVFASKEAKAEYGKKYKELKEKPEFVKKVKPGELKTAGVTPAQAKGIKGKGSRAKAAELKARVQAEIAERVKLSKAAGVLPKAEQANILDELTESLGHLVVQKLQQDKAFELVSNKQALSAVKKDAEVEAKYSKDGQRIEGLTFPDGTVWLVKENIAKGQSLTVLTHELGVHARKLGFNDDETFQRVLNQLEKRLEAGTDSDINAAFAGVPDSTPAEQVTEEGLARLASMLPEHGLIKRLFAAIKQFLINKGFFPKYFTSRLTTADLQVLAQSAIRADIKPQEQEAGTKVKYSLSGAGIPPEVLQEALSSFTIEPSNLNASKDGQTSKSSVKTGKDAVAKLLDVLKFIEERAEKEIETKRKQSEEDISALKAMKSKKPIDQKKADLESFSGRKGIPDEVKIKVLDWLKKISAAKTDETKEQQFDRALVNLDKTLARYYRAKVKNQVKKAKDKISASENKPTVKRKSKYQLEYEEDIKFIVEAAKKTKVTSQVKNLEKRIDRLEKRARKGETTEAQAKAMQKARRLKKRLYGMGAKSARLKKKIEYTEHIRFLKELLKTTETAEDAASLQAQIDDSAVRLDMLEAYSDLSKKSAQELSDLSSRLELLDKTGRELGRINKEKWRKDTQETASWLHKEITGKSNPAAETGPAIIRRQSKEKTLKGRAKGTYQAVQNAIQSWEFILDVITQKSGKKTLQSRAVTEFGSMAHEAKTSKYKLDKEAIEDIATKGQEVFNVGTGKEVYDILREQAKTKSTVAVKGGSYKITPGEAAYWYAIGKDEESKPFFDKMGFTESSWKDVENAMTPEFKEFVDYLSNEFLQGIHAKEDEIYRAINGVSKLRTGIDWKQDGMTIIPQKNFLDVVINRVMDSDHYQSWAVPSKKFNSTFQNPETRGYVEQYYGGSALKAVDSFLEDFAKSPKQLRGDMPFLDKLRSNIVVSMIGANPTTFFKQLTSFPAYAADIPTADFVKNFAYGVANPKRAIAMMKESPMAQERWGNGFERDFIAASKTSSEQMVGGVKNVRDLLMLGTKIGDSLAILAGYTVYKYNYDKAIKAEKGTKSAKKIANQEFEIATERTQQAGGVKDLGSIQRAGSLAKLFTMYMTSPTAYTRQTMAAVRNFKNDPVGSSKRLLIFNVLLPMMFQAVASGFAGALGGDDDEQSEFWKKEARAVALGPLMGIPIARDLTAGIWDSAMGFWYGSDISYSPMAEVGKSLTQAIYHGSKGLREGKPEATNRAINEFFDFLGYMVGLPSKPGRRLWEGWEDIIEGETKHQVMATFGYSRYARGESK